MNQVASFWGLFNKLSRFGALSIILGFGPYVIERISSGLRWSRGRGWIELGDLGDRGWVESVAHGSYVCRFGVGEGMIVPFATLLMLTTLSLGFLVKLKNHYFRG